MSGLVERGAAVARQILDARDPDAVRREYRQTMAEFEARHVRPSWERRAPIVERFRAGSASEDELPHDILTVLLLHREDADMELADDGRVVRFWIARIKGAERFDVGLAASVDQSFHILSLFLVASLLGVA